MDNRFEREEMLIGKDALCRLKSARVVLFGVGGVGAAAAEALARGGIGEIALIDNDTVSITNINRQLCALTSTVGRLKVDVVAERILDIDPTIKVERYPIFFLPDTELDLSGYDYIIDAIDTVSAKIEIAVRAAACGVPVISCMGTGNKLDPTAFCVADLANAVVNEVKAHFADKIYRTVIPRNIRLSEAPSHGKPVIWYDKYSRGAESYRALAAEFAERKR